MKTQKTHNEDLYVAINDVYNKKKSVLISLKDSLVLQEEYEKFMDVRKTRLAVLKEIKTEMDTLGKMFQGLVKEFPNVRSIITQTEKEIREISTNIKSIRSSISAEEQDIFKLEEFERSLKQEKKGSVASIKKPNLNSGKISKIDNKSLPESKVDRIKNNLEVIEQKLKGLH